MTSAGGTAYGASQTHYAYVQTSTGTNGASSESQAQYTVRSAGTYSQLILRSTTTPTAALAITFRVGAANVNMVLSVTASGETEDLTNTDAVVAGNLVNIKSVSGASTQVSQTILGVTFAATTSTVCVLSGSVLVNSTTAAATLYGFGGTSNSATESDVQFEMRTGGTLKNGQVNVTTGGHTTATTFQMRIGGVNGNLLVSCTGSSTGTFEDTTHTDTVVSGSLVNWQIVTGATTSSFLVRLCSAELLTTDSTWEFIGGKATGVVQNANVSNGYIPVCGDETTTTTEANANALIRVAASLFRARIYVSANTVSASSTLTSRKNSGAGNQTATITSSGTGWFDDATNTDALAVTDEINYLLTTANAGTSLTFTQVGSSMQPTAATSTRRRFVIQ